MQSMEAMISLAVFLSISSYLLLSVQEQRHTDDSLYRIHLAEDAWRVLYLRGGFQNLTNASRPALEADMAEITSQTGLCVFMAGMEFTSCRGDGSAADGSEHEITASLSRTALYNGTPRRFTFALGN